MSDPTTPAPAAPDRPPLVTLDRTRLPGAATALGVALVSAAVVLAATNSREHGDLDGSNFTMGVLATLGLLGIAAAVQLLRPDTEPRAQLVSWPGATGALAAGVMLMVLIDDGDWAPYVGSLVVIALSVAGYRLTRSAPFVLSTIAGLVVLYTKAFDDVFDVGGGDNTFMTVGAAVLVFVLAITVAGWWLPGTRVLSGVVVGVGGLAGMVTLLATVTAFRLFTTAFDVGLSSTSPLPADLDGSPGYGSALKIVRDDPFKNDVWMILLYCALLAVLWAGAALATGHVGFRLLLLADGVVIVPLAAFALLASHPTWWEVVSAAVGGLLLLAVGAQAWQTRPPAAPTAPVAPPELPPTAQ